MGRRGIKEYRAPEALALIAADREHAPLVCPSCSARTIQRVPRRRSAPGIPATSPRVSLTCRTCGRHAYYIAHPGISATPEQQARVARDVARRQVASGSHTGD